MSQQYQARPVWRRILVPCALAIGAAVVAAAPALGLVTPYTPDANTIFLYHLNEASGASVAANTGSAGFNAIAFDGNPSNGGAGTDQPLDTTILGAAGFAGFGNSANVSAIDLGLGVDRDASGGVRLDSATSPDRAANHSSIMGAGSAFTLEAMINLADLTLTNREIIATDNTEANNLRGLQFRVNSGNLEFNFIAPNTSAVTAAIPTTGLHAFAANQWFHVAMSYDGASARFYWTRVDQSFTSANLIGGPLAEAVDVNVPMPIVIGNESRDTGGGVNSNEGLRGLIDEVRISNVARSATQFIFSSGLLDCDVDGLNGCTIADFNIIKSNFFNSGMNRAQGDLTGDGTVEFADFRLWKASAGPGFASVTLAGVPEPASALLVVLGGLFMGMVRRRSNRLHS
jgi:hypothetical protein